MRIELQLYGLIFKVNGRIVKKIVLYYKLCAISIGKRSSIMVYQFITLKGASESIKYKNGL